MKTVLSLFVGLCMSASCLGSQFVFSIKDTCLYLNGQEFKIIGLRCSNALVSDATTQQLIDSLDTYKSYGVNMIGVYFMGSRFGDVKGYKPDATLDPVYAKRMARIIEATDKRGMVVLVGCLYWSTSRAKEELAHWTQADANQAIANTVKWLVKHDYRNVFVDPDNEGMAARANGWRIESMIAAAHEVDPSIMVANNNQKAAGNCDLNIHHGPRKDYKPWVNTEATPGKTPGGYWARFSKETHQANKAYHNYSRIGRYTSEMKKNQLDATANDMDKYNGYGFAGTWLQCGPAEGLNGPFTNLGGRSNLGSNDNDQAAWNTDITTVHPDAGILWWMEFVKKNYGPWQPPATGAEPSGLTVTKIINTKTAWPMHNIDNTLWNHNSLSPGDVNKDGFTDYAVMHEGVEKFTFVLHPGPAGDIRKPWQKVIFGEGPNPEYSYFGDFDGDGNLDIVGASGHSTKASTGINIFWGPKTKRVCDGAAWVDGGLIPATKGRGHFLDVRSRDVNGDGAIDIVAGGRVLGTHSLENMAGKKTAGIIWIEAPANQGERRDLSKWTVHDIDPLTAGGHGFIFVDIDRDGDEDIANANADWNTKPSDEMVLWYENPGAGSAKQKAPWPMHVIYTGSEIYAKGQMAAGDIDGDGRPDLCVQTEKSIFYFRQTGRNAVTWERIVIPKPAITQWLARPTKLADINGDGRLDIVGMLIHDEKGNLPAEKASVFWMEWRGEKPRADNWVTHVVKWSDGVNTGKKYQGEKWDHCRFADVDGDGDMDIVGNCEEHYTGKRSNRTTNVGVVWFENPRLAAGL